MWRVWIFALLAIVSSAALLQASGEVDASDPRKSTAGYNFTEYNNGDSLHEQRATGNIGIADNDMIFVRNRLWYV